MDFLGGRIGVELHPAASEGMGEHLDAFFRDCRTCGFTDISVSCRPGMTKLQTLVLQEVIARHNARMADAADPPTTQPQAEHVTSANAEPGKRGAPFGTIEYELRFCDMDTAVERCTIATVLIGIASGLDDTTRAHLRLCAHELAVNTVEHGRSPKTPEICVSIQTSDGITALSYRDNTRKFVTSTKPTLDMAKKVRDGDRRGLGLFILNKLVDRIDYERIDGWNVTSISLLSRNVPSNRSRRIPVMEGLSVKTIPCKLEDTVILVPTGTIDSSTAPVLESEFDKLIRRKQTRIVVDLSHVDFISSAGVGIFLGTASTLRSINGDLIFMSVPEHIEEVLDIINVRSFFVTVSSIDELESADQPQD